MVKFCKMEDRTEEECKIRVPRQERGIKTRNRILKAAKKMFSEQGFHGTNSKQIAAEAGVSIGSFLFLFPQQKKTFCRGARRLRNQRIHEKSLPVSYPPLDGVAPTKRRDIVRNLIQSIIDAHAISPRFSPRGHGHAVCRPGDWGTLRCGRMQGPLNNWPTICGQLEHKPRVKDINAAAPCRIQLR